MNISSSHSLTFLNQTAAVLLASAVTELFPGTLIISGQGTQQRFFYDFLFPFEFTPEFLILIEERMRLIVREKREARLLEMMPANAASMMRHRGQILAADVLDGIDRALVEMCQIGEFVAYSPFPFVEDLSAFYFKILESYPLGIPGRKTLRIVGVAADEKEILKKALKQAPASERSHLTLVRDKEMFEPLDDGLWLWRSQGIALRRRLMKIWEEEHARENFNVVSSPAAFLGSGGVESITEAHKEYFFHSGVQKIAEVALVSSPHNSDPALGLLAPKAYFADRSHVFCPDDKLLEECISSLHFICKIPKILGFEFEIVLSILGEGTQKTKSRGASLFREALEKAGIAYTVEKNFRSGTVASIDVRIADALGRGWTGPYLRIPVAPMPVGKGSMLIRSAFGSLERIAALLLEQTGGFLPLRLAPEQVRILVATGRSLTYAKQVRQGLLAQGIRATLENSGEMLKTRVYKSMMEKVPYVVLLGEREEKGKTLTVRAHNENKEQTLSLDEFCMRLKSEMRSYTSELTN